MTGATLDTTTLASGAVATGGTIGTLIDAWSVTGAFEVALSQPILDELEKTLRKHSFVDRLSSNALTDYRRRVRAASTIVPIAVPIPGVARTRADNLVLATAESAGVAYVVTGDRELQRIGSHRGVTILSSRLFLDLLEQDRNETG